MLKEVLRVLKPGGVALFLTVRDPSVVGEYFKPDEKGGKNDTSAKRRIRSGRSSSGGEGNANLNGCWSELHVLPLLATCDEEGQVSEQSKVTIAQSRVVVVNSRKRKRGKYPQDEGTGNSKGKGKAPAKGKRRAKSSQADETKNTVKLFLYICRKGQDFEGAGAASSCSCSELHGGVFAPVPSELMELFSK